MGDTCPGCGMKHSDGCVTCAYRLGVTDGAKEVAKFVIDPPWPYIFKLFGIQVPPPLARILVEVADHPLHYNIASGDQMKVMDRYTKWMAEVTERRDREWAEDQARQAAGDAEREAEERARDAADMEQHDHEETHGG